MSGPVLSCLVLSCSMTSSVVLHLVLCYFLVLSCRLLSCLLIFCLISHHLPHSVTYVVNYCTHLFFRPMCRECLSILPRPKYSFQLIFRYISLLLIDGIITETMKASNKLVKDRKLGTKPAAKAPPTATPPPKTKKSGTEIKFDKRTRYWKLKLK
jgi:hypothetical protein